MQRLDADFVAIGSGPAGQRGAIQAAKAGRKVLIIENKDWGGSCLLTGTIPSKTLREAAQKLGANGIDTLRDALEQAKRVILSERAIITHQLERNNVSYIKGRAEFIDSHTLKIKDSAGDAVAQVSSRSFLIATGNRPLRPTHVPFDDRVLVDSDTLLSITEQPKTLAILGAGVIGCEYASIFAKMGVQVTLIDRRGHLLRALDHELVELLELQFKEAGVRIIKNAQPQFPNPNQPGLVEIYKGQSELFDRVLYCMGRTPNTEGLELEKIGVALDPSGHVMVNDKFQSSVPHVYAAGDVQGAPGLAASAAEQGRLAAAHACGLEAGGFPASFPFGVYTIPELSSVGWQEADFEKHARRRVTGRAKFRELARGKILSDESGLLKLHFDADTRALMGVHVIGTHASELVHIGQTALTLGATLGFFVENVFNYPTLAEAYKVAALNAYNQFPPTP